jgi:hypothetical protein
MRGGHGPFGADVRLQELLMPVIRKPRSPVSASRKTFCARYAWPIVWSVRSIASFMLRRKRLCAANTADSRARSRSGGGPGVRVRRRRKNDAGSTACAACSCRTPALPVVARSSVIRGSSSSGGPVVATTDREVIQRIDFGESRPRQPQS